MQDPSPLRVSVVIPHLNEPDDLARCLSALDVQRGGIPFEVIVVDNGSREPPADVCARHPGTRLLQELAPGPGPARSAGALAARAPIVAFIDADCRAEAGWLAAIVGHFDQVPNCAVIAGAVGIDYADRAHPTALEAYDSLFSYKVELYVRRDHYAATGNMAVRRHVFVAVGPFAPIGIMEDMDWGERATAKGYRIDYLPAARVLTPACRSSKELARRWDRHVAHEFERLSGDRGAALRWGVRATAIALSPVAEALRLPWRRRDLPLGARLGALMCLFRIRWHRARNMMALLAGRDPGAMVKTWNREGT